jgi:type III secretion protein W
MGAADFKGMEQKLASQESDLERAFAAQEAAIAQAEVAQQAESAANLLMTLEETVNPLANRFEEQNKKSLEENRARIKKREEEQAEQRLAPIKSIEDAANRFARKNPELKQQLLQLLLERIKDCKNKDELKKILYQFYLDPTVADDALDFVLEVTVGDLHKLAQETKADHEQEHGREIRAGRNIQSEVLKADPKLGEPKLLRDLYRDITGNPREPVALFLELSDRYSYGDLRKILSFLFHSLGADLKSQGPSIAPGLLYRLFSEVRSLQAILGVYKFFRSRMRLIQSLFKQNGLDLPEKLSFELISRQFVSLLQERYPSGDKVLHTAERLGIEKWILAKIIVFSQLRDAIREVAIHQFYRSIEHRDELYHAVLQALEQLEEELDELLEKEEEEEKETS